MCSEVLPSKVIGSVNDRVCSSVGRSVNLFIGLSVIISKKGGKLHLHAPIGALEQNSYLFHWNVSLHKTVYIG